MVIRNGMEKGGKMENPKTTLLANTVRSYVQYTK